MFETNPTGMCIKMFITGIFVFNPVSLFDSNSILPLFVVLFAGYVV